MKTSNDCLVCFMRQALTTVRRSSDDPEVHRQMVVEVGQMLAGFSAQLAPPENSVHSYRRIADFTGVKDPYAQEKQSSNAFALAMEDKVRQRIDEAEDPVFAGIQFAISANVMDYGAEQLLDADLAIQTCLQQAPVINDYQKLQEELALKPNILYLTDNCGEIVFDKLLVEQLIARGHQVTVAVREIPIINDATMEDAVACGLDKVCEVITNGTDIPGTSLECCSDSFRHQFEHADMIISKGMGNFECLSDISGPLYFLFTVKCRSVLQYLQGQYPNTELEIGSAILQQSGHFMSGGGE